METTEFEWEEMREDVDGRQNFGSSAKWFFLGATSDNDDIGVSTRHLRALGLQTRTEGSIPKDGANITPHISKAASEITLRLPEL